MSERWKPVWLYESNYEVSSIGRVRSIRTRTSSFRGRILKIKRMKNGYCSVVLFLNGISRMHFVHHLVLHAFIEHKPSGIFQANHIDGNKANNSFRNLEWVTPSDNQLHRCRVLRKGVGDSHYLYGKVGAANPRSKHYTVTDPVGREYDVIGLHNFCKNHGLRSAPLVEVARGKYKQYKGWKCRYYARSIA